MRTLERQGLAIDIAVAAIFALLCIPFAAASDRLVFLSLIIFAGALAVRRLAPGWALGIAWVGALAQMGFGLLPSPYNLAVVGVLYTSARYGSPLVRRVGLVSAAAGALVATVYLELSSLFSSVNIGLRLFSGVFFFPSARLGSAAVVLVALLALFVLPWVTGLLLRSQNVTRETRRREESAQRERSLAEYRAVVEEERGRIARDMHDVVAHSLAVVIAQADGGRFAASAHPETAAQALETIAGVARSALGDVRMLLAELRHDEGDAPQPGLAELPALYEQLRGAGLALEVSEHGGGALGTGHELAAFRIVQEALTNALRHGDPAQPASLVLSWSAGGLGIEVRNAVLAAPADAEDAGVHRAAAPGHGLPGMRERAQLAGGSFRADASAEAFVVSAYIPAAAA